MSSLLVRAMVFLVLSVGMFAVSGIIGWKLSLIGLIACLIAAEIGLRR